MIADCACLLLPTHRRNKPGHVFITARNPKSKLLIIRKACAGRTATYHTIKHLRGHEVRRAGSSCISQNQWFASAGNTYPRNTGRDVKLHKLRCKSKDGAYVSSCTSQVRLSLLHEVPIGTAVLHESSALRSLTTDCDLLVLLLDLPVSSSSNTISAPLALFTHSVATTIYFACISETHFCLLTYPDALRLTGQPLLA
jgi:hypothetical protein